MSYHGDVIEIRDLQREFFLLTYLMRCHTNAFNKLSVVGILVNYQVLFSVNFSSKSDKIKGNDRDEKLFFTRLECFRHGCADNFCQKGFLGERRKAKRKAGLTGPRLFAFHNSQRKGSNSK
jgi:hypothetical protein